MTETQEHRESLARERINAISSMVEKLEALGLCVTSFDASRSDLPRIEVDSESGEFLLGAGASTLTSVPGTPAVTRGLSMDGCTVYWYSLRSAA